MITSSKTTRAPAARARSISACSCAGSGSLSPAGSMITAAVSPACAARAASSDRGSEASNVAVSSRTACGTPALRVVAPMYQSCQPW